MNQVAPMKQAGPAPRRPNTSLPGPAQDRWSLAALLAPTTPEDFFRDTWESAPLQVSHPADSFDGLFGIEDLDPLFSLPGLVESEHFRLLDRDAPGDVRAFEGRAFEGRAFDGSGETLSLGQIYHAFDRGQTINVLGLHRFWPRVGAFCRGLEETLHHRIYCNLFFTPPNAKRLHAHYDDQDVLILQLAGAKRWQVDEHCFPLPLRGDNADEALGDKPRVFVLEQGDLLYLPRGFVHQPEVLGEAASLHLTVGITPHRWVDLLTSAVATQAQRRLDLRRALPPGVLFDPARHHELESDFQALAADCLNSLSLSDAIGHLAAGSLGEMHPLPVAHFEPLTRRDRITLQTRVTRRSGMLCRVHRIGSSAAIQFPGNQVFGPPSVAAAFAYIAAAPGDFAVGDLPGLSDGSKITLVKQLILEGLLAEA